MKVSVAARRMDVTEAIRGYIDEKMGRLPRYYDGLQSLDMKLDSDAGGYLVEIIAAGRRKSVFVARHRGHDLYGCIDQCARKLEEQLRRHKDKVRDRQGPGHEETMQPKAPGEPPAQ